MIRAGLVAVTLLSCQGSGSGLPTATILADGHPVYVELAINAETRQRGLMYRDSLGADAGMLFVYPSAAPQGFWMKNTRVPLSIAFARDDGTIVALADMQPLDTINRASSGEPVIYALEVNQGWFAAHGVEVGDKLTDLPHVEPK